MKKHQLDYLIQLYHTGDHLPFSLSSSLLPLPVILSSCLEVLTSLFSSRIIAA